jgi:hypothetical protein
MRRAGQVVIMLALAACGARTGILPYLEPDELADASLDRPDASTQESRAAPPDATRPPPVDAPVDARPDVAPPVTCGAPDPTKPLLLAETVAQELGGVAAGGCTFAVVWMENHGIDGLPLVARTARVVDGAWTLSPRAIITHTVDDNGGVATIAWDGAAYVVVWIDQNAAAENTLFMRRLSPDGTILGPKVASAVSLGPDSYPVGVDATADSMRLLLLDDRNQQFSYHLYATAIASDGAVLSPPTDLTPRSADVDLGGVHWDPDLLLWADDTNVVRIPLDLTTFAQPGGSTGREMLLPRSSEMLPGGLAMAQGGDGNGTIYFGAWEGGGLGSVIVDTVAPGGPPGAPSVVRVKGVAGADVPELAVIARAPPASDVVGALAGGDGTTGGPSDLYLSTVSDGVTTGTEVVVRGEASSDEYAFAAGMESFGIYWATSDALKLTIRTPP